MIAPVVALNQCASYVPGSRWMVALCLSAGFAADLFGR
jgi:hypothetical protein